MEHDKQIIDFLRSELAGKFRVKHKIARGAVGHIFLGEAIDSEGEAQKVAIKVIIKQELSCQELEVMAREEITILQYLQEKGQSYPQWKRHILEVYTSNVNQKQCPYLYMVVNVKPKINICQYCPLNLDQFLRDLFTVKRLSEIEALILFKQIAQALSFLHYFKILHRDLKFENIMITFDDSKLQDLKNNKIDTSTFLRKHAVLKIIDLGISKYIQNNSDLASTYAGSLVTMAPEIIRGNTYDYKVDIYSLGVLLFFLLTNSYPSNLEQELTDLKCSHKLKELLRHLVSEDPTQRPTIVQLNKNLNEIMINNKIQILDQELQQEEAKQQSSGYCPQSRFGNEAAEYPQAQQTKMTCNPSQLGSQSRRQSNYTKTPQPKFQQQVEDTTILVRIKYQRYRYILLNCVADVLNEIAQKNKDIQFEDIPEYLAWSAKLKLATQEELKLNLPVQKNQECFSDLQNQVDQECQHLKPPNQNQTGNLNDTILETLTKLSNIQDYIRQKQEVQKLNYEEDRLQIRDLSLILVALLSDNIGEQSSPYLTIKRISSLKEIVLQQYQQYPWAKNLINDGTGPSN